MQYSGYLNFLIKNNCPALAFDDLGGIHECIYQPLLAYAQVAGARVWLEFIFMCAAVAAVVVLRAACLAEWRMRERPGPWGNIATERARGRI